MPVKDKDVRMAHDADDRTRASTFDLLDDRVVDPASAYVPPSMDMYSQLLPAPVGSRSAAGTHRVTSVELLERQPSLAATRP